MKYAVLIDVMTINRYLEKTVLFRSGRSAEIVLKRLEAKQDKPILRAVNKHFGLPASGRVNGIDRAQEVYDEDTIQVTDVIPAHLYVAAKVAEELSNDHEE